MITFYSTRDRKIQGSLKEAVLTGLAPDGGLYMPETIPELPKDIIENLPNLSLQEIGIAVTSAFLKDDIPKGDIEEIVTNALSFPTPLVTLNDEIASLELYHGPSMAFKDFGARFMAQLMSWLIRDDNVPLQILVATSGDTGGAVALGFLDVPGIEVTILYPSGRVSDLQEKQLTTNGKNIKALEVEGSFDDCQKMVKEAFQDEDLKRSLRLTSANSINISRLIPQSFYYLHGLSEVYRARPEDRSRRMSFSIPSGNFGNLTAGVFAKMMGAPINRFLAATNVNDVIPRYLESGNYDPKDSIRTISNAMDVGNPSNYERLESLFSKNHSQFRENLTGFRYTDEETREGLKECYEKYDYITDPHGAIGYLAARDYLSNNQNDESVIFLETAHPIKFQDEVESVISKKIELPTQALGLLEREKVAQKTAPTIDGLKEALL